jgi:hypothetical protein
MTEFPKPKTMKKGQPLGRQANYRDFAIVQVDSGADQTQRAWRERGNQTIFAETMAKRRKGGDALAASLSTASLPDTTFLTSSHAVVTTHSTNHNHAHGHHHHGHGHGKVLCLFIPYHMLTIRPGSGLRLFVTALIWKYFCHHRRVLLH